MAHIDFKTFIEEEQPKKVVLMHHWDTDGLACAALFMNYLTKVSPQTEVVLMNPTINNYFLVKKEYEQVKKEKVEAVITTDINFPLLVIENLEEIDSHVFVFDHHAQTENIDRPGVQNPAFPGCTMLVNEYLGNPLSLLAVLGMVGDQEDRIKKDETYFPKVEEVIGEEGLTFEQVLRISKLIDTTYMVGDVEGLHYAIELLREDAKKALEDEKLLENEKRIKQEMDQELGKDMVEVAPAVLYLSIDSQMSLISEVTRARARQFPDKVIVTDQVRGKDASLYVRRRDADVDLGAIVEYARKQGLNSGGKPEVAGVVLAADQLDKFREEVMTILKGLTA
ncbi:DHH family phosphoesterase [Patescibacteria group bacterium]